MKEEQVEKIFKLIEPFLPKQTVIDFRVFLEHFKELRQLNDYNLSVIERQRNTIDQFSQKVRQSDEKMKKYEKEVTRLTKEKEDWKQASCEEREKLMTLAEEMVALQNKQTELETLLKNEIEKNYQFAESVMKMADDNRYMLAVNKKLVTENNELLAEKEVMEQQYTELLTEYEGVQEKIHIQYGLGFKTAHFHHRRKR